MTHVLREPTFDGLRVVSSVEPQSAQNNLCDLCVLGTTCDSNFVTFVLFVVTNGVTTKDAKHTKEETQRMQRLLLFLLSGDDDKQKPFPIRSVSFCPIVVSRLGKKVFPLRTLRLYGEMSES